MGGTFSVVAEVWDGNTAQKSPARRRGLGEWDVLDSRVGAEEDDVTASFRAFCG